MVYVAIRRIWRTVKAIMIICYGDEWRDSKSLNLKQLAVSPQALCHKRAKYCATDKI